MRRFLKTHIALVAWTISFAVAGVAFIAWGQSVAWQWSALSIYTVFPIFGLLAWSLMWAQYVAGALQRLFHIESSRLDAYFRAMGAAVLAAILLHPGLLALQRWRDGFGLPPGSELSFIAPSLRWIVVLGITCWVIFLAFELHRFYGKRKWWQYMSYLSDAAMLGIFYHALRIGTSLMGGWFQKVWIAYGMILVAVLLHTYVQRYLAYQKFGRNAKSLC